MKLTSKQLRKFVKEELSKVLLEDQDDGDIPVFAGPEVIEMPSFQANREKEEAAKVAAIKKTDENWELVLEMLPDEVDKETFKEKVMEAIIYKATEDLGYFSYEGEPPPDEYFQKMRNMKIPKWQPSPNRWAPASDEDDRRTFSNWWLNVVAPGIFHVLGSRHDIYDYAKRWQIGKETAKEAELNREVSLDPNDFMSDWFKEGKIRKSLLTKIIKEELKGIYSEGDDSIPVFAGFGGEISPEELGAVHGEYEEEEAKKKSEEEAKQQAAEKTFPKIRERLDKALSKLAVRDEEKQREIKDVILDELYDRWFGGNPRYWSELSEIPKKTRAAIGEDLEEEEKEDWWERWIYDYIFIGVDWVKRYVKNWKEEQESSKSDDNLTYLGDDPDFYNFFKENKKMRITRKQLTRIIKEEVQSVLKETERVPTIPEFIMSLAGEEGYEPSVDREKQERGESDWFKMGAKHILSNFYMPIPPEERKVADEVFYELIQQGESSENIATRTYVALQNKMDEPGRKEKGLPAYPPHSYRFDTLWLVLREILEFVESASGGDSE